MEKEKQRKKTISGGGITTTTTIDRIGEDLLEIVLSNLPAKSFAYAACVSRSWKSVSSRVLSLPKLSSAISLCPTLKGAVEEVVEKVLWEPIRPHFAILCITHSFNLQLALKYITKKLGSKTPIVTYKSRGIIGKNALSNEFQEILWKVDQDVQRSRASHDVSLGISLTVGFLPGLKVDVLPLLWSEDFQTTTIDKFIIDIREYTNSVSGCTSPVGMIMFGGLQVDMKPVLDKMDYAMHLETFILGDECCNFLYRATVDAGNITQKERCAGVALLFMNDRNKHHGIGDIRFHMAISAGMSPIGPTFKAAAVKEIGEESSTWLSATNGEAPGYIDGQTMLEDIEEELGGIDYPELYIGVTKRRKCFVGLEKPGWSTSMAFYDVTGGDETYLFVHGCGIKTGDCFRFYYPDSMSALSNCRSVSKDLEKLKQDFDASAADKKVVFGGLIFTCCGRGESFFGDTNVDSAPFLENFPGVPFGGMFSNGEIKRGSSNLYFQENHDQKVDTRCCLHPYSSVYLVMSYMPPQLENQI